jgi:hypothetical protein
VEALEMGWYFRKSLRAGPVRVNVSKSGIGVSAGVPGAPVGVGPRGPYVAGGLGGLYFMKALSSCKRGAGGPPPLLIFAVVVSAVLVLWCVLYYCLTRARLGLTVALGLLIVGIAASIPILTGASALLATATGVAFVYQMAMSVPHSVERTTEPSPKWTTWRVVLRGGARGGRDEGLKVLRDLQPALSRDVSLWPGHGEFEEFEIATGVSLTVANRSQLQTT